MAAYYDQNQEDSIINYVSDDLEKCKNVAQKISKEKGVFVNVYPFEIDKVYGDMFDNEIICYYNRQGEEIK